MYGSGTETTLRAQAGGRGGVRLFFITMAAAIFSAVVLTGCSDPIEYIEREDIEKTYTLTVNRNNNAGGTISRNPEQSRYDAGTKVTVTATPHEDYEFTGWTGASTSTDEVITITMTDNMVLTANFKKRDGNDVTYALTTNRNPVGGGRVARNPNQSRYEAGTEVRLTATPEDGYEFTGWTIGTDIFISNPMTITMDSDMAVTANFELKDENDVTYTLTINTDPADSSGGTVSCNPVKLKYEAGDEVIITATPKEGYKFAEWIIGTDTHKINPLMIIIDSNMTVTANFELIEDEKPTYKLTINTDPADGSGGTVTRNPSSADSSYKEGTKVTLTATAKSGSNYKFVRWMHGTTPVKDNPITITMDSDKTIMAEFEEVQIERDSRLVNSTNEAWTSCDQYGSCGDAYVFRSNGTFSRAFKLNNATSWIPVETGTWHTSSADGTNKLTTVSNFTWTTEYTILTNNLTIDGENYDRTSGVTLP